MSYRVHLQAVPRELAPAIRRAAHRTLAITNARAGELTVRLTDSDEMRQLNLAFAHEDHATDVLSFPSGETAEPADGTYFGDIAIALPIAAAQAEAGGHELQSELALLTAHGVLHLLGHDHGDPVSRAAMWRLQDLILADLGLALRSPQEEP